MFSIIDNTCNELALLYCIYIIFQAGGKKIQLQMIAITKIIVLSRTQTYFDDQ